MSWRFPMELKATGRTVWVRCPDRIAHEDLPGLRDGAQSRGDVDRSPDIALGSLDRLAGVDADTDQDRLIGQLRRAGLRHRATIASPHWTASLTEAKTT